MSFLFVFVSNSLIEFFTNLKEYFIHVLLSVFLRILPYIFG